MPDWLQRASQWLVCTRVLGPGDVAHRCSTSEPCGQRCHPEDSLRLLGVLLTPPSSPPLPFCSPELVIENVFIAGPEAGLGRGRRSSLWRCGWGESRRVWLLFSTTDSPTQSISFSLSFLVALFVYCSFTYFSLLTPLCLLFLSFSILPFIFALLSLLSFVSLYRTWLGVYKVHFKCKWCRLDW